MANSLLKVENCSECLELENIRVAKIKRWAELVDQRQDAEREGKTPPPDLNASIKAAEVAINEAWRLLGEHRNSHNRTNETPAIDF